MKIDLQANEKIYFASDQHFGSPNIKKSKTRESAFIDWLGLVSKDARMLFLLGDLFDFWHEWKYVVPRGYIRVLGKLAELRDKGIEIHFFVGNHDLWMKDYFEKELDIPVFFDKKYYEINGKRFLLAHGDGLGPKDKGYKIMKKIFTNPACRWLFRWIHPDISVPIANYLSRKKKLIGGKENKEFLGEEKEHLILYAKSKTKLETIDYLIFGHRHLPLVLDINGGKSKYINLGDWITDFTYGVFDGKFELKTFDRKICNMV